MENIPAPACAAWSRKEVDNPDSLVPTFLLPPGTIPLDVVETTVDIEEPPFYGFRLSVYEGEG